MRIIDRSVFILLLLSFLYSGKIISQECQKDTVYLVFDSSKFAPKKDFFLFFGPEGLYTRYIDDKNSRNIIFKRKHKAAVSVYDTFIFDRHRYTPKRVSKKDIKDLNILDFNGMETILIKKKLYAEPEVVYPNLGIIELSGQDATIYYPVRWERSVSIE